MDPKSSMASVMMTRRILSSLACTQIEGRDPNTVSTSQEMPEIANKP